MTTKQGDVSLLQDPIAQELLQSKIPARLAYTWTDGTPRVVPISFYWDGQEIVLATFPASPKVRALRQNPHVAITIDSEGFPAKVLLIRGMATLETTNEVGPEHAEPAKRLLGEEGAAGWLQQLETMLPYTGGSVRIGVRPEWVGIIDFQQRFPSATERAVAAMQAERMTAE
jgi:hypothetical protein